jgi:hypothetical protein
MCHGYLSRWERRMEDERRREERITYVSDPEEREPVEPRADEEPREPEREVVLTGARK